MTKSSKKKKEKTADFAKAKLKLGKGRKLANNATDTSFKARSITLPHQTIGLEKDATKPVTRRNLTLDDLLIHIKHYNPGTRKDAISGLRELLESYPKLLESSLTHVIQTCAKVVGDENAEIRKAVLEFFSWFLRLVPIVQLRPHAPLFLLFITSAQTHIFPAIRIDAVRFLDLLLELIPDTAVNGWYEPGSTGNRVLEGYLGLLGAGASFKTAHQGNVPITTISDVSLAPHSKLVVLSSLATFLHTAVSPYTSQSTLTFPTWYMASIFATRQEYLAFCSLIQPIATTTTDRKEFEWSNRVQEDSLEDFSGNFASQWDAILDPGFSLGELGAVGQTIEALISDPDGLPRSDSKSLCIARLAHTLHPILVSTWLDVAPAVFGFGNSGVGIGIQSAISVGTIAGYLYGAVLRDSNLSGDARTTAFDDLTALLGYMSTYLPCISEVEEQSEQSIQNLSFAYCELTSLAVMELQHTVGMSSAGDHATTKLKRRKMLLTQIERVGDYLIMALDGELKSSSHPLGYSLAATSYINLLPAMWSLLKYQCKARDDIISKRICTSIVNHAIRTNSRSAMKGTAVQFVGILVLLSSYPQTSLEYSFVFTPDEYELFKEWFLQLPKVLWELGTGDPPLTETILRLLLRIAQRRPASLLDTTILASVHSRFIPYFATVHPQKGELFGPFSKLETSPLRRLALNVASILLQHVASSQCDDLKLAVDRAVNGTSEAQYWSTLLRYLPRWNVSI